MQVFIEDVSSFGGRYVVADTKETLTFIRNILITVVGKGMSETSEYYFRDHGVIIYKEQYHEQFLEILRTVPVSVELFLSGAFVSAVKFRDTVSQCYAIYKGEGNAN